jgi:hypothetical protein
MHAFYSLSGDASRGCVAEMQDPEFLMTEIETTWTSAQRKASGAIFTMNLVPPDVSDDRCLYKNPMLGLNVGFAARFVYDNRRIERDGKLIQGKVLLGIVLVEDELRQRIEKAAGQRLSKNEIETSVRDCYELVIEFVRAIDERQYRLGIQPHIYELPRRRFTAFSSESVFAGVSPDTVEASGAVQVV